MDILAKITTVQVRCPCGKSFKNADSYLGHKRLCRIHQKRQNGMAMAPTSRPRAATVTARASIPTSTPRPAASIACWCGNTFKNHAQLQEHGFRCAVYMQQMNALSSMLGLIQVPGLNTGAGLASAAGKRPIPPTEATAQNILCICGRSFTKEKGLEDHLRYSKTHQAGTAPPWLKDKTAVSVPFTAPHTAPTSMPSAVGPVPGTILTSMLSTAPLISCTCGHVFETQRILELHKRDSLYHRRQANKSYTQNQRQDDALVSCFSSLKLEPVSTQAGAQVTRLSCVCGRTFTSQKALGQHKEAKRRHVRLEKRDKGEKMFQTPRPQYQEDEYLRAIGAALAQQNGDGE